MFCQNGSEIVPDGPGWSQTTPRRFWSMVGKYHLLVKNVKQHETLTGRTTMFSLRIKYETS